VSTLTAAAIIDETGDPARYLEIEDVARDEILNLGGSLSHHHGIGKLRRKFVARIMSAPSVQWNAELKRAVDPKNIFGCGNTDAAPTWVEPSDTSRQH
jgi:FAD/FMN-containing dehydrogenase